MIQQPTAKKNKQQIGFLKISNNNVEDTTNPEIHMVAIAVVQDISRILTPI